MKPSKDVSLTGKPRRITSLSYDDDVLDRYCLDEETGCWNWTGRLMRGYGQCKVRGQEWVLAQRVFYTHHVGPIPEGLDIHHRCGNRRCVNPEHLEPITRGENVRALHGHTILSWEKAEVIRTIVDALCAEYGIRPRTIAAIGERRIWNPDERPKGGDARVSERSA